MVFRERFPGGAPLCGFDEPGGVFGLLGRAAVQIGDLIGPIADQTVFVESQHDFIPVPGPGVLELIGVVEVRRDDGDDDQQQAGGTSRGTAAFPPPSRYPAAEKGVSGGETDGRKHDPQVRSPHRGADARTEPPEVVHHQVGVQRHDAVINAVIPDVRQQVEVDQHDPGKQPSFPVQEPDGKRQQHGVGGAPGPDGEIVVMADAESRQKR